MLPVISYVFLMLAAYLIEVLLFPRLRKHQSSSKNAPPPGGAEDPFLNQLLIHKGDKIQTSQELRWLPLKLIYRSERKWRNLLFVAILWWSRSRSRNRIFVVHFANMSPAIIFGGKLFWAHWTSWSNHNNGWIGTDIWLVQWGVKAGFSFYFWNNFDGKVHFDHRWTLIGRRIGLDHRKIVSPLEGGEF